MNLLPISHRIQCSGSPQTAAAALGERELEKFRTVEQGPKRRWTKPMRTQSPRGFECIFREREGLHSLHTRLQLDVATSMGKV